jgi:hypothetical protein
MRLGPAHVPPPRLAQLRVRDRLILFTVLALVILLLVMPLENWNDPCSA